MRNILFCTMLVYILNLSDCSVLGQYHLFSYKDVIKIDTSIIKNNINNCFFHRAYFNNKLHLHLFNKYLLGNLISEKTDESNKYFYVFDLTDSNIFVFKDLFFNELNDKLLFNNNLYFIASRGNDRKSNASVVKVDLINRKLKEFVFEGSDVTQLRRSNDDYTGKLDTTIFTTDSAGNMKLLCFQYKTSFNIFKYIFFFSRGWGKTWGINTITEQRKWYIFDENLNLLYTEPYQEKRKK